MVNKPLERPEMTRALIDYYISEGRRMRNEEISALTKSCFHWILSKIRQAVRGTGRLLSSAAAKQRDRAPLPMAGIAKR